MQQNMMAHFKKNIYFFLIFFFILFPYKLAHGYEVKVEKDALKSFTKAVLAPPSKPYLLRAFIEGDTKDIELYIIHSYYGDHRFRSASVRWIDGILKKPKLIVLDTDFDCSSIRYGGSGCRKTVHSKIMINKNSWDLLYNWSLDNKDEFLNFQLQSDVSGKDFNFSLDAKDIIKFNDGLLKL